ncbi:hypothetical protein A9Q74_04970 [Colwellia sp. 39_35_sub15_T18]|nr:hypothetical protein A9Q74_04970 [Colwellia sp. 39_35_sub15_T18]
MALYSWFLDAKKKQNNNSSLIVKEAKKSTIHNKYLESYTMWPIARVIQGQQVTPPLKKELLAKKDENARLTATKSTSVKKISLPTVLAVRNTNNTV